MTAMSSTAVSMSLGGAGSKRIAGEPPAGQPTAKRARFSHYDSKYDGPATSAEIFKELRERHLVFRSTLRQDSAPLKKFVPRQLIHLVLEYAADPTLPENDDEMNAAFVKRWRAEKPLDRITITVSTSLPIHEQLRCIFNAALDLIRHPKVKNEIFAHFAAGGPLRRLTSVMKVAEQEGVLQKWDKALLYLFGKICLIVPEAKGFLKTEGFADLSYFEKTMQIRKWMAENPEALKKAETLVLNPDKYQLLPPEIGMLSGLKKLDMRDSLVSHLPFSFDRLQTLEQFFFYGARLTELNESFTSLQALRVLEMPLSKLKCLPDSFGALTNLEIADFGNNDELASLPDTIVKCTKLVRLGLRNSLIARLHQDIGALKDLEELDLEGVIELEELPPSALQLTKLQNNGYRLTALLADAREKARKVKKADESKR